MNFPHTLALESNAFDVKLESTCEGFNPRSISGNDVVLFRWNVSEVLAKYSGNVTDFTLSEFDEHRLSSYVSREKRRNYIGLQNCIYHALVSMDLYQYWVRLPSGKPVLMCDDFDISIAHSDTCLLVAISRKGRFGVDVEAHQSEMKLRRICTRYGQYGVNQLSAVREWTLRESLIKALNISMAECLSCFRIESAAQQVLVVSKEVIPGRWASSWLVLAGETICILKKL